MKRFGYRSFVFVVVLGVALGGALFGCSEKTTIDQQGAEEDAAESAAPETAGEPETVATDDDAVTTPEPAPPAQKPTPPPAKPAPPAPRYATVTTEVPAGAFLTVEFETELSSETSMAGDAFSVRVTQDLLVDDTAAIPAGSIVHGSVTEAIPTKKIGGQASLTLSFESVDLPDGVSVPLMATMISAGKKQTAKDAGTIAGSTAGGALLGRILEKKNKKKATAIGAAVGAAVGTAIAAKNEGDPVTIEPGALVDIQLEQPVEIRREVRVD